MIDKMPISLKVITLFNFKSFKGKIVIDNIQPFTAIIGSIGSGKSNIMDAISFVLGGKLSALRVKHLNELVHGAFNQKPTVEGAYVTIIILTEENQEKSYTRMIQKKGSQYKIDNKIVTRDFYMIELKEIGLDIKAGNFLISQGCIQYFATINMPKELTVMFEEISGSIVYKAEYERLQLELLKINQEIHFAYQTKKGQLRRKKSAIIEKTEAEKYLQLQKQYMEEKLKFQLTQLIFMKKKIESLQNKQKNIKLSIDEQLQSKEAEMTSLKHIKFKVKSLSDLLNEIEENIIKLEDYIRKKKQEYINVENQIEYWQKKRNYACTSLDGANNACKIHKKTVKELKDELKILEKLLEETSSENDIVEFHNSQCVSLDGCSFHRNGIISGGLTALTARAKQWENIQSLSVLKEQKIQLKQELISLPNISHMQSDFDIINKNINQFTSEMEVIEKDIKDITEEIKINETKLNDLHKELSLQDTAISKIQQDMQIKDEMIKNIEKNIDEIKNHIFIDFCKEINVPNITYYEQNLCTYKERLTKKMENINRKNYINNQLTFEKDRSAEFEEKISSWEHNLEKANKEYEKACKQEQNIRTAIEQEEKKLLELKNDYKIKEKYLEDLNKELIQCRSRIGAISELYLETQKAYMATQSTIDQEKAKCETIVKECKLEGITIPILSETIHESSSNSNLSTESLITNIDFSQISEHVRDSTDLQNIIEQSKIKLTEIQNEFKTLQKPNLKAHKKIDLIIQQIKDINRKHEELRIKSNNIGKQFEKIKAKRHKLFSDCLECITAEIDSIYKNLTNDMSAQAFIISENPEEPYTSGINYSCIPSSKRIQPLQNLSDGEKSIANLALLFAILRYKPVPFFIMDEGDAALDNVNINKLIRFIRSKINNMQIIVITLNKRLASRADILIGVTTQPGPKCTESMIFAMPLKNVKNTRN
ncbi:structural maintenance of chromosomes protein 1A-like isoform X1 [Cataglyphis hispanica]|uniref:structural maintenance of chromosomes protein 1A-like isoform X1 n=1 Tax=Cataglyphis hispanica TaxID=1086592 RepID=UPI00217FE3A3|nr:structural maintenance of chromosomes protein 1A-like isoform X1 [Cataglyphis hispanica]